tara:strand:- start:3828 stop:4139 length:312 start_codon:yes stop_codon:yes gene_type:complete
MIDILQEVTDWGKYPVSNGIYHVNGAGQLVAYQAPKGELKTFNKPMKQFSKSRRKFVSLGQREEELAAGVVTVQGSNGKVYIIDDGKCSCPGFTFRGNCKHIK